MKKLIIALALAAPLLATASEMTVFKGVRSESHFIIVEKGDQLIYTHDIHATKEELVPFETLDRRVSSVSGCTWRVNPEFRLVAFLHFCKVKGLADESDYVAEKARADAVLVSCAKHGEVLTDEQAACIFNGLGFKGGK